MNNNREYFFDFFEKVLPGNPSSFSPRRVGKMQIDWLKYSI